MTQSTRVMNLDYISFIRYSFANLTLEIFKLNKVCLIPYKFFFHESIHCFFFMNQFMNFNKRKFLDLLTTEK